MLGSQRTILIPKKIIATNEIGDKSLLTPAIGLWTAYQGTGVYNGGSYTLTGSGTSAYPNVYCNISATIGNVYYYHVWARILDKGPGFADLALRTESNEIMSSAINIPTIDEWYLLDAITVAGATSKSYAIHNRYDTMAHAANMRHEIKEPMCIDLTKLYGKGREPTDVIRLRRIFKNFFPNQSKVLF